MRRAIAAAIDREALVRHKLEGQGIVAAVPFAADDPFAVAGPAADGVRPPPYDPAEAARLLDEAGLVPGPDGVRLALEYKTSTGDLAIAVAKVIREDLRRVGIRLTIRPAEWGVFFHDVQTGNFEIYTLTSAAIADPDFLRWLLGSENVPPDGSSSNRGGYRNPELDRWLANGAAELDPAARVAIYAEAQRIVARDLPVVPLWHVSFVGLTRAHKRTEGR